jgi:MFS family permease
VVHPLGYLIAATPLRLASAGSVVAIPILAVQQLGDVALGGALTGIALAPAVLAAPLAGVALDRARRPQTLMLVAALVTAIGFAAAAFLGDVPTWLVAVLLALTGCAAPCYLGGLSSFATRVMADGHRASASDALSYTVASVAGPAIVATAVLVGSARLGMLAMAAIAIVGALGMLRLRLPAQEGERRGLRETIAAGARHLVRHRPIAVVTSSGTLSQLGGGATPVAAVALSIERSGDPDGGAVIVTAFAIGGLAGALVATMRRWTPLSPSWVMGGGFVLVGACTALAIPDLGMPAAVAALGLAGYWTASSTAAMMLLRTQQSPALVRSQVFTVGAGLRSAAAAAGAALAGLVAGSTPGSSSAWSRHAGSRRACSCSRSRDTRRRIATEAPDRGIRDRAPRAPCRQSRRRR